MLKQSYTADNFEHIFDIENRKSNIKDYLGVHYAEVLAQIKTLDSQSSQIRRKKISARTEKEIQLLNSNKQKREDLTVKKKEIQRNELEKISKKVNSKDFKFSLEKNGDKIFVIQNSKEAFFAIKQLQYNIRKTFKVKQSSRHLVLSQIKLLLNENSPKYLIRTDVSKFFESIPQDRLLKKIKNTTLLNIQSKKFITQILDDFNSKKDTEIIEENKGIPRGVGISSYLSELYMKDIDNQIKNLDDVIYYARYVDDILIVISPKIPKRNITDYFSDIKLFFDKEDLTIHTSGDKYKLIDLSEKVTANKHHKFTYLGYTLNIEQKPNDSITTTFGLSQNKKDRIEKRVSKCIEHFNKRSKYDIKTARKELLMCLRFLTSNTKLSSAKSRVKIGIYYSNDLLDESKKKEIKTIDSKFKGSWLSSISPYEKQFDSPQKKNEYTENLKEAIKKRYSFFKGFEEKTYHSFSRDDLKTIKMILK